MEDAKTPFESPAVEFIPSAKVSNVTVEITDSLGHLSPELKIVNGVVLIPTPSDDPRDPLVCIYLKC
jgi:hypothetical protein